MPLFPDVVEYENAVKVIKTAPFGSEPFNAATEYLHQLYIKGEAWPIQSTSPSSMTSAGT